MKQDLQTYLHHCYLSQHQSDISITSSGGHSLRLHKLILAAVSPFLAEIFQTLPATDEDELTIFLPDFQLDTVKSLLESVYKGECLETPDHEIVKVAQSLGFFKEKTIFDSSSGGQITVLFDLNVKVRLLFP